MMKTAKSNYACHALIVFAVLLGGCVNDFKTDVIRLRAYDAYRAGDIQTARRDFKTCVERDPTDFKSHYWLGRAMLEHMDDPSLARQHLELAYEIRTGGVKLLLQPRRGDAKTAVPTPTTPDIADALAKALDRQKNPPQLFGFLRQQVRDYGAVRDYLRLAVYLEKVGDNDSALIAYQKATKIAAGKDVVPYLALAEFYDTVGDRDKALIELRKAYGIDPRAKGLADKIRKHGIVPGPTVTLPYDAE